MESDQLEKPESRGEAFELETGRKCSARVPGSDTNDRSLSRQSASWSEDPSKTQRPRGLGEGDDRIGEVSCRPEGSR
jgi:hypothetical protein